MYWQAGNLAELLLKLRNVLILENLAWAVIKNRRFFQPKFSLAPGDLSVHRRKNLVRLSCTSGLLEFVVSFEDLLLVPKNVPTKFAMKFEDNLNNEILNSTSYVNRGLLNNSHQKLMLHVLQVEASCFTDRSP